MGISLSETRFCRWRLAAFAREPKRFSRGVERAGCAKGRLDLIGWFGRDALALSKRKRRARPLQIAAALFAASALFNLFGCQLNGHRLEGPIDFQRLSLGQNAVGEECWAETGSMAYELVDEAERVFNVFCNDWEWPSARVFRVTASSSSLEAWLGNRAWRTTLDIRMHCSGTVPTTILDDTDAILLSCQLNNGGWPYMALVTRVGGATYLADGIPAALPSIESFLSAVRKSPTESGKRTTSLAMAYVKERLKERLYRAEDLRNYYLAMMLGQYFNGIKAFPKAEKQYWQALSVHEKALGADNSENTDALMHIALELSNQEQFERADQLFRRVEDKIDLFTQQNDYARYKSYSAIHAANQGRFAEALELAREATQLRRGLIDDTALNWNMRTGPLTAVSAAKDRLVLEEETPQSVELAHSLYIEAAMQECLAELVECDRVLGRARSIVAAAADAPPLWEPQLENLDGLVEDSRKRYVQAEKAHAAALSLFEERAPQERPTALSYLDLGNSLYQAGRWDDSVNAYREAVNLIRRRNQSLTLEQISPYLDILLARAQQEPDRETDLLREMFEAAQLIRSSVAARDIAKTMARLSARNDEVGRLIAELQAAEQLCIRKRQEYEARLGDVLDAEYVGRLERIRREIDEADRQIELLGQQVQQFSPRYLQLMNTPVDAEQVLAVLRQDEAFLQILVGKSHSFAFLLRDDRVRAFRLTLTETESVRLIKNLRKYFDYVSRKDTVDKGDAAIAKPAYELYASLIEPLATAIEGVSHLVVEPSGPLLSLPLGVLLTQPPHERDADLTAAADLADLPWLARLFDLSVVPSAQSFVYLKTLSEAPRGSKSLLAFGGFVSDLEWPQDPDIEQLNICLSEMGPYHLYSSDANLPGSEAEVQEVASLFPAGETDVFLGFDFNEAAVKAQRLDEYRILYFATHALLPDELECKSEPALATSLKRTDLVAEDGFLTSQEISDLKIDAELVVLSACNTGGPEKSAGESLSGLARAFFFAGARSLLVTHWQVHDRATRALMVRVFRALKSVGTTGIAEALRKAQMAMMEDSQNPSWVHPYYWGAFSVVGYGSRGALRH